MLIVGTLQKRVLVKFLHLMSEGSKQKIDCRRSYMAFYVLSDNRGIRDEFTLEVPIAITV